jgi:ribosomal protein S16
MRIKLLNMAYHRHRYWWFIAQPIKKKLNGRHLEKLGVWAPTNGKTYPR